MEMDRMNGQGKRYYVTNHALDGPGMHYAGPKKEYGPVRYGHARPWKPRRAVDGERYNGRNGYDIAEGSCYMADIEFDAEGTVTSVRYDLVCPARKA